MKSEDSLGNFEKRKKKNKDELRWRNKERRLIKVKCRIMKRGNYRLQMRVI